MALIWDSAGAKCTDQVVWCKDWSGAGTLNSRACWALADPGHVPCLLPIRARRVGWPRWLWRISQPSTLKPGSAQPCRTQIASSSRGLLHELQPQVYLLMPNPGTNIYLSECFWEPRAGDIRGRAADGSRAGNTWNLGEAAERGDGRGHKLLSVSGWQWAGSLWRQGVMREGDSIPQLCFLHSTAWTRSPLTNCEWRPPTTSGTATSARRQRRWRPCRMVREEERHTGGCPGLLEPLQGVLHGGWSENQQPKQFCPQEVDTGSSEVWLN